MKIKLKSKNISGLPEEAVVMCCFEDKLMPEKSWVLNCSKTEYHIIKMIEAGDLRGKSQETQVLFLPDSTSVKRIILVGLGKRSELDLEKIRAAFALVAKKARELRLPGFTVMKDMGLVNIPAGEIMRSIIEGIKLGLYQFTTFKTEDRESIVEIDDVSIWHEDTATMKEVKKAAEEGEIIADAVIFARNLVSMPSNEMTPRDMAKEALAIGKTRKHVKVSILDEAKMKELGMNALLGVSQGSREDAQFIVMDYTGTKKKEKPIVLIGKGLTFDSGGISLKPAENMEEMKTDMAGGAAVMGTIMAAADLNLPLHLIGFIPATENMPGGVAYKPGDILKTMSGLTVEVISTDAEGRLILADALTYAQQYKPAAVIDVATLTGACIIALGEGVIGMMGKEETLKDRLRKASDQTGEKVWELPLFPEYYEAIKSDIADLKNVGGRPAGAITAGAFLSKFADDVPWVHLDIAGPSWVKKERPYIPKGASGVGVRLLIQMLKDWSGR